ncbi:MAG: hypothetical protein ACRCU2_26900 [Planktothrix sp.]
MLIYQGSFVYQIFPISPHQPSLITQNPVTERSRSITQNLLPITYYPLPITHYLLPIT